MSAKQTQALHDGLDLDDIFNGLDEMEQLLATLTEDQETAVAMEMAGLSVIELPDVFSGDVLQLAVRLAPFVRREQQPRNDVERAAVAFFDDLAEQRIKANPAAIVVGLAAGLLRICGDSVPIEARDLAKLVGCRYQTFRNIRNAAERAFGDLNEFQECA